jgi:cellular nucleic acid-binding protein
MPSTMVANPYGKPRDIQPTHTTCELCDRTIKTKDWNAHKNSKAHRKKEEDLKPKENRAVGFGDTSGNDVFGTEPAWGNDVGGEQDVGWGVGGGDSGFGDSSGFGASSTNTRGGGGACYGCGEMGHSKRDCPKGSGRGACYNCGIVGHNKADCPEEFKPRGGGNDRACFNCGIPG